MATNRGVEMILGAMYPRSMRHLQQLIMDAEACAKTYGKKGLFGRDKFQPAFDAFMVTLGKCIAALVIDGYVNEQDDTETGVDALNAAMLKLEEAYGNWPSGFKFWRDYYSQFKNKIKRER